jgi:cytochrome c
MLKPTPLLLTLLMMLWWVAPSHAQDAAAGEAVFKKCKACHQIGADAKNGVGPTLNGIIGLTAGSVDGFRYGADLVSAGEKGLVWTEALLADYIGDPRGFLRAYLDDPTASAKMSFKLKDAQQRLDVAAYLATVTVSEATAADAQAAPKETRTVEEVIADQVFTEEFMSDSANIENGKTLWFKQCTLCHGYKAYPGKAPKLKPNRYKPEFVFKRTYKGFKKMPAWRETFTIDEIRAMVAYIKNPDFAP